MHGKQGIGRSGPQLRGKVCSISIFAPGVNRPAELFTEGREVSALTKLSEVIASAESRASQIRKNFPDRALDGFDIYDAIGRLVAIRKI